MKVCKRCGGPDGGPGHLLTWLPFFQGWMHDACVADYAREHGLDRWPPA